MPLHPTRARAPASARGNRFPHGSLAPPVGSPAGGTSFATGGSNTVPLPTPLLEPEDSSVETIWDRGLALHDLDHRQVALLGSLHEHQIAWSDDLISNTVHKVA